MTFEEAVMAFCIAAALAVLAGSFLGQLAGWVVA